jgi:replication factor A1
MSIFEQEEYIPIKIEELETGSRNVDTMVKVIHISTPKRVTSRRDLSSHRVAEALVGDDTGSVYMTLWDDDITKIEEDQYLEIKNAHIKLFRESIRLSLGRYGSYDVVDNSPFEEVKLENNLSDRHYESRRHDYSPFGRRSRQYTRRRY